MAIDSREKRASATNFYLYTILPAPDGTIGPADRIQVGGEYSGIAAAIYQSPSVYTIRERIILAILLRVAQIQISKGYSVGCGSDVLRAQNLIDHDYLPLVALWPLTEESTMGQYGKMINIMPLRVECLSEIGSETSSVVAEKMLGDIIENIMGIEWTLPFTNGSSEIVVSNYIVGAESMAIGYVSDIIVTAGTWGGGDAAGTLVMRRVTGTFQAESLELNDEVVATTTGNITATAMIENVTNNLADEIEYMEGGVNQYPDDSDLSVGAAGMFNIKYITEMGNPYNN